MSCSYGKIRDWGNLLRLPNLFTLPGDVLAGFVVASSAVHCVPIRILPVLGISALLYSTGLILNDIADLTVDRNERPGRPLPSGKIGMGSALSVAILMVFCALSLAFLCGTHTVVISVLLVASIALYNFAAKKNRIVGAIVMGLCRGLNVALGASVLVSPSNAVMIPILVISSYIGIVTYIAAAEMSGQPVGWIRRVTLLPGLVCCILFFLSGAFAAAAASLVAIFDHLLTCRAAGVKGVYIPPLIGRWIRGVILLQVAMCASVSGGGYIIAAMLLAMRPVSALAGRKFYGS